MNTLKIITAIGSLLAFAGCAGPSAVEADFGNSVRQMVSAQQAHPEVSRNPDPAVVDGTDADRLVKVLKTYREDVAVPTDVKTGVAVGD